jgi:hypothetical protein
VPQGGKEGLVVPTTILCDTLSAKTPLGELSVSADRPSTLDCKTTIHGDGESDCDLVVAAFTLMENLETDPTITVDDGLALLDHPGVIAEVGARILYVRTGRDGLGWGMAGENGLPFCVDKSDWLAYLGRSQ